MEKKPFLFNKIATVYGLFFNGQVKNYRNIFDTIKKEFDFSQYQSVIDIGSGTGALCKVLQEWGLEVTGLDPAEAMLKIARKKTISKDPDRSDIDFVWGDVLKGLPFCDKSFDLAISSYVAHGLSPKSRKLLYEEMKRVTRHTVVFYEYNQQRSLLTDIVEFMEGGDYFNFILTIKSELKREFGNLKVINTGPRSALYICQID
ncbi:MAG: class I SAM-dependent methyltransferase [Tissierellia bacterium]|nr:class I SAM-dependent methyltransferase [Tissierellia bacterium]